MIPASSACVLSRAFLPIFVFGLLASAPALALERLTLTRLKSCDVATVRSAAELLLNDPDVLQQPHNFYYAAQGLVFVDRREDAVFHYLLGKLRSARARPTYPGEARSLLRYQEALVEPNQLVILNSNPALAQRAVNRALAWDRSHPDPYRDGPEAQTPGAIMQLAASEAAIRAMPSKIAADTGLQANARLHLIGLNAQMRTARQEWCADNRLDEEHRELAIEEFKRAATEFVRKHPLVLMHVKGDVERLSASANEFPPDKLPKKVSVGMTMAISKDRYSAIVDVLPEIRNRRLQKFDLKLRCVLLPYTGPPRGTTSSDQCDLQNAVRNVDQADPVPE